MKHFLFTLLSVGLFFTFSTVHAADKEAKDGEEAAAPSIHFVELSPLILPIIDKYGASKTISLVVAVEVDSQEKADKVTKYQPRLTDAYLSDLYGRLAHKTKAEGGIIPLTYVKKRLNAMSSKVLGEEIVSDVLVQVLQSRRT